MKTVMLYPIQPSADGMDYEIVAGAKFLFVSELSGHYYLHALVNTETEDHEMRRIAAYPDHRDMPDAHGEYIASAPVSYRYNRSLSGFAAAFHFFDQTEA